MTIKLIHGHVWRSEYRRSRNIKTDNCSFEMVEEFKYLGTTVADHKSIQEEIQR